jgi:outer membrane lipoprotein-sorting protein
MNPFRRTFASLCAYPRVPRLIFAFLFTLFPGVLAGETLTSNPKAPVTPEAKPSAAELLADSDRARGAAAHTGGMSWTVKVKSTEAGRTSEVEYQVRAKGDHALAVAILPPRSKGETLLLNDRVMWFYKPGIKKPVSISSRQKLTGQASNGDIASTRYARDYDGELVGEESLDGVDAYKLELKAKNKQVTYDRIRFWIAKHNRLGIKAEFLTVGGDLFKTALLFYDNKIDLQGKSFPFVSEMRIVDALNSQNVTSLVYGSPKTEEHQDQLFNVNQLLR